MTDEEFNTYVNAVKTIISDTDKNPAQEFTRFWLELCKHEYKFDRQDA